LAEVGLLDRVRVTADAGVARPGAQGLPGRLSRLRDLPALEIRPRQRVHRHDVGARSRRFFGKADGFRRPAGPLAEDPGKDLRLPEPVAPGCALDLLGHLVILIRHRRIADRRRQIAHGARQVRRRRARELRLQHQSRRFQITVRHLDPRQSDDGHGMAGEGRVRALVFDSRPRHAAKLQQQVSDLRVVPGL